MELTRKQEEGLRTAVERYRHGEKYTCIAGYAGTGKSTLVRFIVEALDIKEEDICYVAFTGKAATVLQQKGCENAVTAHKLLYHAKPKSDGTFVFIPKSSLEYKMVVVDEISMLPKAMWERLLKHDVYILAMGDPGQLPPIDKDEDNHVLDNPHVFLDEIMRQAQDSEIIRLSMWIREGKSLATFPALGEQVQIFAPNEVVSGMYSWADQVLCATNAQRNAINDYVRQQKGFGIEPEVGDKIISLRNHWEFFSDSGNWALTNGCIGTIEDLDLCTHKLPYYITDQPIQILHTQVRLDDGDGFSDIPIDYKGLKEGEPALTPRQSYLLSKNKTSTVPAPYDFAYAYAITCHKAQGSEWDKVLIFEEKFPFDAEDHKRWLYTAVTRASKKCVAVRKA